MFRRRKIIVGSVGAVLAVLAVMPFFSQKNLVQYFLPFINTNTETGYYLTAYLLRISYPYYLCILLFLVKLFVFLWKWEFWNTDSLNKIKAEIVILLFVTAVIIGFWFVYVKMEYAATVVTIPMMAAYAAVVGGLVPRSKWYKVGHEYIR